MAVIGTLRRWLRASREKKLKQVERDSRASVWLLTPFPAQIMPPPPISVRSSPSVIGNEAYWDATLGRLQIDPEFA